MSDQQPNSPTPSDGAPEAAPSTPPPPPPTAGQAPPPPPPPPPATSYGQPGAPVGQAPLSQSDERLWGMLGHLGGIVLGFVAPLITWLVFRERSSFVDDQGKEALNFQITVFIAYVVASVLSGLFIGFFLIPLVWLANVIFCIIAGIAANRGEQYRYPFALRLVK